jgi:hypothetical protein
MPKKTLSSFRNCMKQRIIQTCTSLSRDARVLITLILFLGLGGGSIFITIRSIYNIGRKNAEKEFMEVEHIKRLELEQKDSLNTFKIPDYGTTREFE